MKRKFIMMLVLIQGPKQPGNDIDVYLRPLVDEILLLWKKKGVRVWNENREENFNLRALLLSHLILRGKPNASHMCARIRLHTYDRQKECNTITVIKCTRV
jgi:hypothetical protein